MRLSELRSKLRSRLRRRLRRRMKDVDVRGGEGGGA